MLCIAIFILDILHSMQQSGREAGIHTKPTICELFCHKPRSSEGTLARWLALQSVEACLFAVLLSKKQWPFKKENRKSSLSFSHTLSFSHPYFFLFFSIVQCKIDAAGGVLSRRKKIAHFHLPTVAAALMLLKCCS